MAKERTKEPSSLELTPEQYQALSDPKATALIQLADKKHRRQAGYAAFGMTCGTISFLACIAAFVYLVMEGHAHEGYFALGTAVLAMIGRMIGSRL